MFDDTLNKILIDNFNHDSIVAMVNCIISTPNESPYYKQGVTTYNEFIKALMNSYSVDASQLPLLATKALLQYSARFMVNRRLME